MSEKTSQDSMSTATLLIAIYQFVLAIITLIPSLAIVGCGGLLGGLSFGVTEVDAMSGIITILGMIGLVVTVALVVAAVGLLTTKPWSYMGSIILNGVYVGLQLIGAALGGGLSSVQLIFIVLSGAVIFILTTNEDIKRAFGRA